MSRHERQLSMAVERTYTALLRSPRAEDVALDGTEAIKAPSSATDDKRAHSVASPSDARPPLIDAIQSQTGCRVSRHQSETLPPIDELWPAARRLSRHERQQSMAVEPRNLLACTASREVAARVDTPRTRAAFCESRGVCASLCAAHDEARLSLHTH